MGRHRCRHRHPRCMRWSGRRELCWVCVGIQGGVLREILRTVRRKGLREASRRGGVLRGLPHQEGGPSLREL